MSAPPRLFLSASFPKGDRGETFAPYNPAAILDAVVEVCRVVLRRGGTLTFGAHPCGRARRTARARRPPTGRGVSRTARASPPRGPSGPLEVQLVRQGDVDDVDLRIREEVVVGPVGARHAQGALHLGCLVEVA